MWTVRYRPNISEWDKENGYNAKANRHSYPIRVFSAKRNGALRLVLTYRTENKDIHCRRIAGFRIFLNTPGEVLSSRQTPIEITPSENSNIFIKPKMIIASNDLRSYSPEQKECYFSIERKLRFFKFYTQQSCETECLANYTWLQCGCVKFSMPRSKKFEQLYNNCSVSLTLKIVCDFVGDENMEICGMSNCECHQRASMDLFGEDVVDGLKNGEAKKFREMCNCLPDCTFITYDFEVDRARQIDSTLEKRFGIETAKIAISEVMISFREQSVVTLKREERYSFSDFLAICGGLFGLFLGISVLSVIEFFYFSTLRLFWTFRQRKSESERIVSLKPKTINSISVAHTGY